MAAYRQAKRMQRGALTAQGGFSTTDPALLQVPCTIQCVFSLRELDDIDSTIFATTPDNNGCKIQYRSDRKRILITGANAFYSIENASLDNVYNITFVCDVNTTKVYYGGNEVISNSNKAIISIYYIGSLENSNRLNGYYFLHRRFNYAMSADEVKGLDNNDPMGYVVPKAKRAGLLAEYLPQNIMESRKGPEVEHTAETYEFNIGSPYSQTVVSGRQYPFDCIYRVDYVVDEWDFQPKVSRLIGFVGTSGASVIAGVKSWIRKSDAKIGEVQSCFIKMPNEGNPSILLYGDQDTEETTARHLKVTIKGITPVSVPISWLDSAKQLPLSDEYMEPLFQSIGGYDMAANGAPEILYNE